MINALTISILPRLLFAGCASRIPSNSRCNGTGGYDLGTDKHNIRGGKRRIPNSHEYLIQIGSYGKTLKSGVWLIENAREMIGPPCNTVPCPY